MKNSPLIFSTTLIASLALLASGSVWSNSPAPVKQKSTASAKAKLVKSKIASTKSKPDEALNAAQPVQLASTQVLKSVPVALAAASTEVVPAAVNPYLATSGITIAPATTTAALPAPVLVLPVIAPAAIAAPVVVAPTPVAPLPAPILMAAPTPKPSAPVLASAAPSQPAANANVAKYNPYLSYQQQYQQQLQHQYQQQAVQTVAAQKSFSQIGNELKSSLPSLPSMPQFSNPASSKAVSSTQAGVTSITNSANKFLSGLTISNLKMMLPLTGDSNILPTIKKVYPTGEKPLVVINFKCPTEVIGITPPPMKLLHEAINFGFDGLNKTDFLSFNLQQVCS